MEQRSSNNDNSMDTPPSPQPAYRQQQHRPSPPDGYVCRLCNVPGHWIKNCPQSDHVRNQRKHFGSHTIADFISEFDPITDNGAILDNKQISLSGRVQSIRHGGQGLKNKRTDDSFEDSLLQQDNITIKLQEIKDDVRSATNCEDSLQQDNSTIEQQEINDDAGSTSNCEESNSQETNIRNKHQEIKGTVAPRFAKAFQMRKEAELARVSYSTKRVDDSYTGRGVRARSVNDERFCSFGNNKIRREWEKIDNANNNNRVESFLEQDMKQLLLILNGTEVGSLCKTTAALSIEIPDGEGGSIRTKQDQNLADAAKRIMQFWRHDDQTWTKEEANLAGRILLRMEQEELLCEGIEVGYDDYLAVINAYAKVASEDETAAIRSENILDHMQRRAGEGRADLMPDRLVLNTVMGAQSKSVSFAGQLNLNNIKAAERMLDRLEQEYANGDRTMQPTSRTYSKFIDLYAKNGHADAAASALERMEHQYSRGNKAALPKTIHYTSVIDAFAKSACSNIRAARTAEEVLRSMLYLYDRGEDHLAPDAVVFSAVIDAYANSKRPDAGERSLSILDLMNQYDVKPDIVCYNIILKTLSCYDDTHHRKKAREILQYIEESPYLQADSYTYNSVIKASSVKDAENLIQHWELQYKIGNTKERPDSYSYVALIKSLTSSDIIGYEEKCIKILKWMEEQQVVGMSRIAYNEVMRALARSDRSDAGMLTDKVFKQLVTRYEETNDREMRPDKYSYMSLMNAYSRNCNCYEDAIRVETVLFEIIDQRIFRPDTKICNQVIIAWARSGSEEAITHVREICNRMDSLGIRIDGVCYNSMINVHVKTNNGDKSAGAWEVLLEMQQRRVAPTAVTYTLLLEACLDDEEYLLKVFESCVGEGMLDERLRTSFLQHGPACVMRQLQNEEDIPFEWTEHANRGPGGLSRNARRGKMKFGSTGRDIRQFGWAR